MVRAACSSFGYVDLAAQDVVFDLLELRIRRVRGLADHHAGSLRSHCETERFITRLPLAFFKLLDRVLRLIADARDAVRDIDRIAAASVRIAADDVRVLFV